MDNGISASSVKKPRAMIKKNLAEPRQPDGATLKNLKNKVRKKNSVLYQGFWSGSALI